MASRSRPQISRVVQPRIHPGAKDFVTEGPAVASAPPGSALLIVGQGFGRDPQRVAVTIGKESSPPFPGPLFAPSRLMATVPLLAPGETSITVTVGGVATKPFPFS